MGAYALAGELTRAAEIRAGFAAYEAYMRPIVEAAQGIPKVVPRLMHPKSRLGIGLLHRTLDLASRPAVQKLGARLAKQREAPTLPDHGAALG